MKFLNVKFLLKAIVFTIFAVVMSSCGGADDGDVIAPPSSGSGGGGSTPVGTVSNAGFWVEAINDEFPTYMNSELGFGTNCIIEKDAPLGTLSCIVDVMELDLYSNPLRLQYNVPPDMCQFHSFTPSWHWNYSVGKGPEVVTIRERVNDEGQTLFVSCTASRDSGGSVSCGLHPEILNGAASGGPTCAYNHSLSDSSAPNCCMGSYTLRREIDSNNDGSFDEMNDTPGQWGGDVRSCIGGPPRTGTGINAPSGYPANVLTQVPAEGESGLNAEIQVASNIQGPQTVFSYPSNFYTSAGNLHNHRGIASADTSNLPYAFNPIDDLDGSTFDSSILRPGNPSYTFACRDEADEVKYAIFVYVREWNTLNEFLQYGTSEGAIYNPDVGGTEANTCPGIGDDCNDRFDFDDLVNALPGDAYNSGPGTTAAQRNEFFPRVDY